DVLAQDAVLAGELNRTIARAVEDHLTVLHETEPVLEPDLRSRVDAEEIARQVAEVALAERAREAVRHAERAAERRQPQRRRQTNQREVRLREPQHGRIVIGGRLRAGELCTGGRGTGKQPKW